jgi:ABC-type Fe3+ transport system permease subunit
LGAAKINVLRRVVLPQLTPSLLAAALLTFMTSMASFSAPLLFGGDVRVLTLDIFTARQRGDDTMAVTETVILAVISLGALIFFQRYEGTRRFAAAAMKGAPRRRVSIASGPARVLATVVAIVFAVVLVLPVATLFVVSFAREGSWTTQTLPSAYTFANYQRFFSDQYAGEVFFNSVTMSVIAAVGGVVVELCCSYLAAPAKRTARICWRGLAQTPVPAGFDSVGAAGNRGRSFRGSSLWSAQHVVGLFCTGGNILDPARGLFPEIHATGRESASGQHGAARPDARGGRRPRWGRAPGSDSCA